MEALDKPLKKEVKKIYPNKLIKDRKMSFYLLISSIIVIFIILIYLVIIQYNLILELVMLVFSLILMILSYILKKDLERGPHILYEDGIKLSESPLNRKRGAETKFIEFKNIEKIEIIYNKFWISFKIILKKGKHVFVQVDSAHDFNSIIILINNFKGKTMHELI